MGAVEGVFITQSAQSQDFEFKYFALRKIFAICG